MSQPNCQERLRTLFRRASQQSGIAISAISLWELAWLATHGRLDISGTAEAFVERITSRTCNPADHGKGCDSSQPTSSGLLWRPVRPADRCDGLWREGNRLGHQGYENPGLQAESVPSGKREVSLMFVPAICLRTDRLASSNPREPG